MTEESTLSSVSLGRAREVTVPERAQYLTMLMLGDAPMLASSRHALDGVDEVRFGRGPRSCVRERVGRREIVTLRIPDVRMSADHGRLVFDGRSWVLDDPSSKNGAIVDGVVTRRAVVRDGALVELGHTCFLVQEQLADRGPRDVGEDAIVGEHSAFTTFDTELAKRFAALVRIAPTSISVVLIGETGTGKELVARALHELSGRSGAFVGVNCGALPATLIEAELFGSRRGAFSGATHDRIGLVRSADGGTLLLDEIGELPTASQAAFLRVLQEREVQPVGADSPVAVDLRVCAATLHELDALAAAGGFRQDLYARLAGFLVELPPLRQRRADLGLLIRRLLARLNVPPATRFAPEAMRALLLHTWPYNIRELGQALSTAVALADTEVIELAHLPEPVRGIPPGRVALPTAALDAEDDVMRAKLGALLATHRGNVRAVAKELGCKRTQVYRYLERFGIRLEDYRR